MGFSYTPVNWGTYGRSGHGYATPQNDHVRTLQDDGRHWAPPLRSTDQDIIGARPYVEARVKDQAQLSGIMAGAINLTAILAIGKGPRIQSTPNWRNIPGATEEWAEEFSGALESAWKTYTTSPENYVDSGHRFSFYSLLFQAFRCYLTTGEILAMPKLDRKQQLKNSTCLMLIDPARLATDPNSHNKDTIKDGIELDDNGAVKFYHIANENPRETRKKRLEYVQTAPRGKTGRKLVLHYLDPVGAEQTRGISPFAPALEAIKQQNDLAFATRQAANLQASYLMAIKSKLSQEEIAAVLGGHAPNAVMAGGSASDAPDGGDVEALQSYVQSIQKRDTSYFKDRDTGLQGMLRGANRGSMRPLMLLPDQEIEFHTSNISPEYTNLARNTYMEIARGMNLSLETVSGDYSELSFSGGSISLAVQKASVGGMAERVLVPLIKDLWRLWLEMYLMTDEGAALLPAEADYWTFKDELAACSVKLGLPLTPDLQKTAKAVEVLLENRAMSLEEAAAMFGYDAEDSLMQQKKEQDLQDGLGLRNLKSNVQEVADQLPDNEGEGE